MFRILAQCGAQVRTSLEGLDYFVAEGGRAFVTLQEVIDQLVSRHVISPDSHKDYHALLLQAKQYLRTDFKVYKHRAAGHQHGAPVKTLIVLASLSWVQIPVLNVWTGLQIRLYKQKSYVAASVSHKLVSYNLLDCHFHTGFDDG
jgi:hypothetical protein